MLDNIGHGREACEQRGKACRHIELHVDQERRAEAQSEHANQREKFLAAARDGIGGELPDKSSPHSRFSVMVPTPPKPCGGIMAGRIAAPAQPPC
jgi:hypothetical protein